MNLPPIVRWATGIRWQWKVFIPVIGVLLVSLAIMGGVVYDQNVPNKAWVIVALAFKPASLWASRLSRLNG